MNSIKVPHGVRNQLADLFKVSLPTVRKALEGKTDNELANRIRKAAKEYGGKERVELSSEFTAENKWIMRLGAATIVADLSTGQVVTRVNGETRKTYQNPPMSQMTAIQEEARQMLNL